MNLPAKQKQKAVGPAARLQGLLGQESIRKRFDDMLGQRSGSFLSSIISAVNGNKALGECEPMSVISAAAVAASIDLPINPSLAFAHIVPYKGVAQFQMGWRGFVQLGMRTGQYKTMNAAVVYEGQLIDENPFTGEMIFDAKAKTSEKVVGYVFYFRLVSGFEKYTYMTKEQCEKHGKRYSQTYAKNIGKWVDDFDAMALKTVVKRGLGRWGILSVEMQKAIEMDQAGVDADGNAVYVDSLEEAVTPIEGAPEETGPKRMKKALGIETPSGPAVGSSEDIAAAAAETTGTPK